MPSSRTLFVFDDAPETAEVLQAVYEPHGVVVRRRAACRWADEHTGADGVAVVNGSIHSSCGHDGHRRTVVIGRFDQATPPGGLPSAFEYRDLISAVDRLLATDD